MDDFSIILGQLAAHKVRTLVVGGVAVVWRGHPRFTADLDLMCPFDPDSVGRLVAALKTLGFQPRAPVDPLALADDEVRRSWLERNMVVLSFWSAKHPITSVDVFVEHPMELDALYGRAAPYAPDTPTVRVASIEDLIGLKTIADRDVDRADIAALQLIQRGGGG